MKLKSFFLTILIGTYVSSTSPVEFEQIKSEQVGMASYMLVSGFLTGKYFQNFGSTIFKIGSLTSLALFTVDCSKNNFSLNPLTPMPLIFSLAYLIGSKLKRNNSNDLNKIKTLLEQYKTEHEQIKAIEEISHNEQVRSRKLALHKNIQDIKNYLESMVNS